MSKLDISPKHNSEDWSMLKVLLEERDWIEMSNMKSGELDLELQPNTAITEKPKSYSYSTAVFFVICSWLSYWSGNMLMKVTNKLVPDSSPFEILIIRNIVAVPILLIISQKTKESLTEFKGISHIVMFWAIGSIVSFSLFLYALKYTSVTKVNLISNCHPILAMTFAYFILRENISKIDKASIGISIIGIYFIVQNNSRFASDKPHPEIGYLLAACQCWCFASISVGLRVINQKLNCIIMPFYFSIISIVMFLIIFVFDHSFLDFSKYSQHALIIILCYVGCSITGQLTTNLAFKYAQASELAPLWNLSIILNFSIEWLGLGYNFVFTDFFGTFIMICSFLSPIILRKISDKLSVPMRKIQPTK